jgi:hypothetical protein
MTIRTFALTQYRKHDIYVRNFQNHFEYLTVHNGKIYTAHLSVRPDWRNRVLYFLRRQDSPYSKPQVEKIYSEVVRIAQITIDNLISPPKA